MHERTQAEKDQMRDLAVRYQIEAAKWSDAARYYLFEGSMLDEAVFCQHRAKMTYWKARECMRYFTESVAG